MILHFYNGESIQVSSEKANKVNAAIDAGAEWLQLNGNRYKVTNIASIESGIKRNYKTYDKLGLPDITLPEQLKAAYDRNTITVNKRLN